MRSLTLTALAAAAFVTVPAAFGATMHPELGAKLSGMGEHGVVNIQVKSTSKQLCWTFDLATKGITGASIHTGSKGVVLLKLGNSFAKKGCVKADPMVLEHLETWPGKYWVWVDTKAHP